jgi:hypothetical protein
LRKVITEDDRTIEDLNRQYLTHRNLQMAAKAAMAQREAALGTTIKGARERETNDIHERAIKGGPREMSFHRDQVSESVGSLQS